MAKPRRPAGLYAVAVVFFFAGLICTAELLNVVFFSILGFSEGLDLGTIQWVVIGYFAGLGLVCYGTNLLMKSHPLARWLMVVMTLVLTVQTFTEPAVSPFYSTARIYLNRVLLVGPMIASCIYLLRVARSTSNVARRA